MLLEEAEVFLSTIVMAPSFQLDLSHNQLSLLPGDDFQNKLEQRRSFLIFLSSIIASSDIFFQCGDK